MRPPIYTQRPIRDPAMMERMRTTFELYELAEQMMRQKLRRQNPGASEEEIEEGIQAWLHHRPGAEHGDYALGPERQDDE